MQGSRFRGIIFRLLGLRWVLTASDSKGDIAKGDDPFLLLLFLNTIILLTCRAMLKPTSGAAVDELRDGERAITSDHCDASISPPLLIIVILVYVVLLTIKEEVRIRTAFAR